MLAKKASPRCLKVEGERGEGGLAFLTVESILVARVGVVPKEHPDVGSVLARDGASPVSPGPDLEKGEGWQWGDVDRDPLG